MTSRVVTNWIEPLGTTEPDSAEEIAVEMATKEFTDSFPPFQRESNERGFLYYMSGPGTFKNCSIAGFYSQ